MNKPYDGWSLDQRDPQFLNRLMAVLECSYRYYFRVKTDGWHHIPPDKPVLFVGSHNGGLASPDTSMMLYDWLRHFGSQRPLYGLMHPNVWTVDPFLSRWGVKAGAIRAHPKMAIAALNQGYSVLVYPGGAKDVFRPYSQRAKIELNGNKAFIKLALRYNVPIIPVISKGAHDTLIVLADIYDYIKPLHEKGLFPWLYRVDPVVFPIYLGLPWIIAFGPLPNIPLPIPLHTRVCAPIAFEWTGKTAERDRTYVNQCYQFVVAQMQEEMDRLFRED